MLVIFSFNRPDSLLKLLKQLYGKDTIYVIDDGSDYDYSEHKKYCEYIRTPHRGKKQWWKNWSHAFHLCQFTDDNHFLFLVDDWKDYDIQKMKQLHNMFDGYPYAFNFANHGVTQQWTGIEQWEVTIGGFEAYRVGFVDCCFSTNRAALELLGWQMDPISETRWEGKPTLSSGVGNQLSKCFLKQGVPMLKPKTSMCKKRGVKSEMNPREREINPRPLI